MDAKGYRNGAQSRAHMGWKQPKDMLLGAYSGKKQQSQSWMREMEATVFSCYSVFI